VTRSLRPRRRRGSPFQRKRSTRVGRPEAVSSPADRIGDTPGRKARGFLLSGIRCRPMSQRRRPMLEISPLAPLPTAPHPSPTLFRRSQNSPTTLTPRPTAADPTAEHLPRAVRPTDFQPHDHHVPTRSRHSDRRPRSLPGSIQSPFFPVSRPLNAHRQEQTFTYSGGSCHNGSNVVLSSPSPFLSSMRRRKEGRTGPRPGEDRRGFLSPPGRVQ